MQAASCEEINSGVVIGVNRNQSERNAAKADVLSACRVL